MWANGNGGGDGDDCGADGYATSIYTISVGAVSVTGEQAWFDESCSAKMVVNYVTGADGNSAVVCPYIINRVHVYMCASVGISLYFRVQQPLVESVPPHLVEQVLQLQWQLESLPSLWKQSGSMTDTLCTAKRVYYT